MTPLELGPSRVCLSMVLDFTALTVAIELSCFHRPVHSTVPGRVLASCDEGLDPAVRVLLC